jgi:hypothetical protein
MYINRKIIDNHQQIYPNSCVPSGVEMVLKLEGIMNSTLHSLQEAYGNNPRSGDDFDNKEFSNGYIKIKFHKVLLLTLKDIFHRIEYELKDNRYVLIPLKTSSPGDPMWTCHIHLIYNLMENGEYQSLTKLPGQPTIEDSSTKKRFTDNFNEQINTGRLGIDFLTYERI